MQTGRGSSRYRPHSSGEESDLEPKANILQWTLAFGLLVGTLAGIAGWAVSDEGALELGLVGFFMGGLGGFLAAVLDRYTPHSQLTDWEAFERLRYPDRPPWQNSSKFNTDRISSLDDEDK